MITIVVSVVVVIAIVSIVAVVVGVVVVAVVVVVEDLICRRSDQNRSDRRRWAYLIAYNTKRNNPVMEHHHPLYSPLSLVGERAPLGNM